jgi:hypothetical protein
MPASTTRSFPAAQPGEQHVFSTSAMTVAAVDRLVDQLPGGVQLHRRAGRRQWQYGPEVQELEAQLKAQQVYEQTNGQAVWSLGAAFWELRFPKG